jgi:hypothetical protein
MPSEKLMWTMEGGQSDAAGSKVPEDTRSGWLVWWAGMLAGWGGTWLDHCPKVGLAQVAQALAGSCPCGPLDEFPAGLSLPPAP